MNTQHRAAMYSRVAQQRRAALVITRCNSATDCVSPSRQHVVILNRGERPAKAAPPGVLDRSDWLAWLELSQPEAELLRPLPAGSLMGFVMSVAERDVIPGPIRDVQAAPVRDPRARSGMRAPPIQIADDIRPRNDSMKTTRSRHLASAAIITLLALPAAALAQPTQPSAPAAPPNAERRAAQSHHGANAGATAN